MNTISSLKWAVSLVAVAASLVVTTGTAKADPKTPAAATGGMGIMAMGSVRQQIRDNAKTSGMWQKGTTIRLQYNASRTTVTAGLYNKTTFGGGPTPIKPTRLEFATAKFHLVQVSEGKLVKPVNQGGNTWQMIMRGVAPPVLKK